MNNYDFQNYLYKDIIPVNNDNLTSTSNNTFQNETNRSEERERNQMLFSPREAFIRGNLFRSLYTPYKNYQPINLAGKTEQERMFLELAQLSFAAHELNLYLDNYPNDTRMIRLFNDYRKMANESRMKYERKFGPISITSDSLDKDPWQWVSPFPWDEGGM